MGYWVAVLLLTSSWAVLIKIVFWLATHTCLCSVMLWLFTKVVFYNFHCHLKYFPYIRLRAWLACSSVSINSSRIARPPSPVLCNWMLCTLYKKYMIYLAFGYQGTIASFALLLFKVFSSDLSYTSVITSSSNQYFRQVQKMLLQSFSVRNKKVFKPDFMKTRTALYW